MSIKICKRGINKDERYLISEKKIKEIFMANKLRVGQYIDQTVSSLASICIERVS